MPSAEKQGGDMYKEARSWFRLTESDGGPR